MANKKIINLDNLKKFRQEYDTRISGGAIPVGKALTAKQLEPVSEESGSEQTAPFLFQATSTDNNTTSTPTAPIAKHLELRGNAVIWNQMIQNGNFASTSGWSAIQSYGSLSASNNKLTYTILQPTDSYSNGQFYVQMPKPYVIGHKYLLKITITSSFAGLVLRPNLATDQAITLEANKKTYCSFLFTTSGTSNYIYFGLNTSSGSIGDTIVIENAQLFDLTKLCKEYESALAFNRDYPLPYYSYNAGIHKSCKSSTLENVKQNQFQELNAFIEVIAGKEYYISGISAGGYIEEYDGGKNLIKTSSEITSTTTIELSENTHYVKVQATTYTDIMLCVYWGDGEDYSYKPYGKYEYPLPEVELRSVGNVYDVLYSNGTGKRRIGVIKLKDLNWSLTTGTTNSFQVQLSADYKGASSNSEKANISCNVYEVGKWSDVYYQTDGVIGLNNSRYLGVTDTNYTDATTFKNHFTDNDYLYIEYATEQDIETTQFAENAQVDDMGTMKYIPSEDNLEPVIPQGNKFFYPADYVLFLDDMYNRSKDGGDDADVDNFVTQSELTQAIGNIPTGEFGFPFITAPSSTTLTADEVATISKGAIFLGSSSNKFLNYEKIVFFQLGDESFGENGGFALCVNGFVPEIRTYRINSQNVISINDATTKRTKLASISQINGKNVDGSVFYNELASSNIGSIASTQITTGWYKNVIAISGGLTNAKDVKVKMSNGYTYTPTGFSTSEIVIFSGVDFQSGGITVSNVYFKDN